MTPVPRVYRRTRGSRALAVAGVALFGALCAHSLLDPPEHGAGRGLLVCGALLTLSLALVVGNFGDRIEVDGEGVRFRNAWREKVGLDRPRLLRWEEVEDVREMGRGPLSRTLRSPAYLVRARGGRRFVLDSIEGIEEIAALLGERAGAELSGPFPSGRP